ncbi:hypothetical protein KIN20_023262 [Parelaphostrongylus tenuis]|uniref:Uncharacterized protein n=1 Tax=Parelaphostrongylus tenuis TaxID=148309 RepID=A0AAD5QSU4_PARTN|nr:hypothetical protein KIN20_023262 [Parelaphostrongylus tenuis]
MANGPSNDGAGDFCKVWTHETTLCHEGTQWRGGWLPVSVISLQWIPFVVIMHADRYLFSVLPTIRDCL